MFAAPLTTLGFLLAAIALDHWFSAPWFSGNWRLGGYLLAYLPTGFPVIRAAFNSIRKGEVFSEFFLMTLATVGAFVIGEFAEAVTVMLFYAVGETFQTMAVRSARTSIQQMLDQRPEEVLLIGAQGEEKVKAASVQVGALIRLKAGERLALDGILESGSAVFNAAALTGESMPVVKRKGDVVLAGMINLNQPSEVVVNAPFADSKLSRVLELVQQATARKAPTELFIRKFASIYTPIVVAMALLICFLPMILLPQYQFSEWLYRALVFLVISCPCALVISIPLGYFGGIGAASRHGILVKGGNFLDLLAKTSTLAIDKTGTLTEGVFRVQEQNIQEGFDPKTLLPLVYALEKHSTHSIAAAIVKYIGRSDNGTELSNIEEIPGFGLRAMVGADELLVGNQKLMKRFAISGVPQANAEAFTWVGVACGGRFAASFLLADQVKPTAGYMLERLNALGISSVMLSGDKEAVVQKVAAQLGVLEAYGDLLPEEKVQIIQAIKSTGETVAFAGDGFNDAPALAISDIGIAMGGLGSDAAIETADIVIQDDRPEKIALAIQISKKTKQIVWQNIAMAFFVKALVLGLGAGGIATMWEAVFADVGVALLAIFNAVRIQRMAFKD